MFQRNRKRQFFHKKGIAIRLQALPFTCTSTELQKVLLCHEQTIRNWFHDELFTTSVCKRIDKSKKTFYWMIHKERLLLWLSAKFPIRIVIADYDQPKHLFEVSKSRAEEDESRAEGRGVEYQDRASLYCAAALAFLDENPLPGKIPPLMECAALIRAAVDRHLDKGARVSLPSEA